MVPHPSIQLGDREEIVHKVCVGCTVELISLSPFDSLPTKNNQFFIKSLINMQYDSGDAHQTE